MSRSQAIETLVSKTDEAMKRCVAGAIASLIGTLEPPLMIGTDPDEWVSGTETVNAAFEAQFNAMGGIEVLGSQVEGRSVGTVGWFADRPTFRLSDGGEVPVRVTGVAVLEGNSWKVVQT